MYIHSLLSLTDWRTKFVPRGLKASHPGITESIPVRGTPRSSEDDMSPRQNSTLHMQAPHNGGRAALNLQHFNNHVHFSKCDRMHPSDSGCSLHTGVCRLQQPACMLQQPAYERGAACCSMQRPAYRRNAGRITPVCRLHTLVCSLHTSVWRLRTLVLQPSCSLHASLVWTRHR